MFKADVYKLRENPATHTFSSRLVAVLKKGSSFGVRVFDLFSNQNQNNRSFFDFFFTPQEVALMNAQRRTATVCCQTDVSMLAIEQEDFIKIFMANDQETEPDFITFLRQISEVTKKFFYLSNFHHLVSWISH
jgi:CRP-like cAMP-binding protein